MKRRFWNSVNQKKGRCNDTKIQRSNFEHDVMTFTLKKTPFGCREIALADSIPNTFWQYSGYILVIFLFWLHFAYILPTFWLHSDYILTTFWHYILTTFWLNSDYIQTISDWLTDGGAVRGAGWVDITNFWYIVLDDHWSKHCQRHNGPEGWVLLTKVISLGRITNSYANLDQTASESQPSTNFKISIKHQHFDKT